MSRSIKSVLPDLFSLVSRERCMTNFKNIRVPIHGKIPQATAAVLVLMCRVNNVASLLYTVRPSTLKTDCGQTSFPGGKTNKGETPMQTALRETKEEIGLMTSLVDVWGQGPGVPDQTYNTMVTPVVGCVADLKEKDMCINDNEVMEVFTVPIEMLCDPDNQYYTQFKNGYVLPVYLASEYKIWGITSSITHMFLSSLLPKEVYKNEFMKKRITIVND